MDKQPQKGDYYQVCNFTFDAEGMLEGNALRWPIKNVTVGLFDYRGNRKMTCISIIVYNNGEMGVDPSESVRWPEDAWVRFQDFGERTEKYEGFLGVPQAVLMEFFLILFEQEVVPGAPYYQGPIYPRI